MEQRDIDAVEYTLARLAPETKARVASTLNDLANNYFSLHEEEYDPQKSLYELAALEQLVEAGMLLFSFAEICISGNERSLEIMRDEKIYWGKKKDFREHNELYNLLFEADYPDLQLTFGTPVTHNEISPGHIGFVRLTYKPQCEEETASVHTFLLDHNALLDWTLGLAFIASQELRSPFTELVLSETGEDNEDEGGNDTAA